MAILYAYIYCFKTKRQNQIYGQHKMFSGYTSNNENILKINRHQQV